MNLFKILFFIFLVKSANCFESDSNDKIDYVVKITSQTGDRAVHEGESIVLLCDIRTTNGNLPLNPGKIQYRWTFNGLNLNAEPRKYNNNNQLIILKTDYSSDLGEYKCIAYVQPTNYPYESSPYSLNIHWISKIARIIHFKYPESDEDIDESLKPLPIETINQFKTPFKLALKCEASGYPELQIDWYFNNEQIIASNVRLSGSKYSVENNNLYIIGQDNSVSGVYTCSARNSVNSIISQNNFLIKAKNKKNQLELKSITNDQIVNNGQKVILNCEFNNHEKIQWYSPDSNLITNSSRILISANSSVLTINQIDKQDEGVFKCIAYRSDRKQQLQYSIRVQIAFIDEFASDSILALYNHPKTNSNVIIIPEKTNKFELLCLTPNAQPNAKIYWLNPENKVISNQGLIRVLDNHQLMFQNAQKEFDGVYQCVCENVAGRRVKRFTIKVQKLPLLINMESHTELTIKEQKNITLNCLESNLTDNQYYTINWYHNGSLISTNDRRRLVNTNGQLLINFINLSDEGLYICSLNHIGYPTVHNSGFNLRVIELLKFIQLPVDRRLELNRPSKTHCRARTSIDSSNLKIRWIKGDSDLLLKALKLTNQQFNQENVQSNQNESNQEQQHLNLNSNTLKDLKEFLNLNNLTDIKDENGYLIIKQMTKNLSGFYSCLAFTTQELIFTTIRLDAYIMPKFNRTPPEKLIKTVNDDLQLDFVVYKEEDTNFTIKYDKDNDQNLILNNPRIKTFDNGTLFIFNLTKEDTGIYSTLIGNELGFIRAETNLIVKNKIGLKLDLDTIDEASFNSRLQKTVGIALAIAFLYIVAIIGLLVWYRIKRKSTRLLQNEILQSQSTSSNNSTGDSPNGSNSCTKSNSLEKCSSSDQLELKNSYQLFNQDLNKTSTYLIDDYTQSSILDTNSIKSIKSIESFNRKNLQQIMLLGNGEFGNVFLAKAIGLNNSTQESMVMVKSLQNTESLIVNEFNQEIEMFKNVSHNNITKLMAVCYEQDPKLMILEYSDFGDLKQFLLATRLECNSTTIKPEPLNKAQLLRILIQITDAMNYLSSNNFIHKDLATRNVLISSSLDIKLTLCSLSNDTYSKEYIKFRNRNLPLRWASYDAIFNNEWSVYSDIYSFAVVFWELIFCAELPYFDLKDEQVFNLLKCKQLKLNLDEFDLFSDNLLNLIKQCLNYNQLLRPSFITLNNALINELNFINN